MSKSLKYGEFEFPTSFGFNGSAGKTMVRAYARGGGVKSDEKQDKAVVKAAVGKHESNMHPGKPKTALAVGGPVAAPGNMGVTRVPTPLVRPGQKPTNGTGPHRKPGVPVSNKNPVISPKAVAGMNTPPTQSPGRIRTQQAPAYAKGGMCSGGIAKYKK